MIVMADEEFLSTKEALKMLDVTAPTFLKWVREMKIEGYQGKGRTINYKKKDVQRIYAEKVQLRPMGDGNQ